MHTGLCVTCCVTEVAIEVVTQLEARMKNWNVFSTPLSDIFQDLVPYLKAYATFINGFENAISTVERLRGNPEFSQWLDVNAHFFVL